MAGTSLRAVRHYHEVGLLAEPERRSNGYKQYGVKHLIRLLRIKRLVDLGFSLPQVTAMAEDDQHPEEALRALDAELAATIERLQRARLELGLILRERVPTDLPAELAPAVGVGKLSEADRSLVTVMSRIMGQRRTAAYAELLRDLPADPTDGEFDDLPADASDEVRQDLAERMAPFVRRIQAEHPEVMVQDADARQGARFVDETAKAVMREVYNSAQLDVLGRLRSLMQVDRSGA